MTSVLQAPPSALYSGCKHNRLMGYGRDSMRQGKGSGPKCPLDPPITRQPQIRLFLNIRVLLTCYRKKRTHKKNPTSDNSVGIHTHTETMCAHELSSWKLNLIAVPPGCLHFCPELGRFPAGGAFCPQLHSLTLSQPPIGCSKSLNFKGLEAHQRRGPWPDLSWNSNRLRLREEVRYSLSLFRT